MYIYIAVPNDGENGQPAGHGGEVTCGNDVGPFQNPPEVQGVRGGFKYDGFVRLFFLSARKNGYAFAYPISKNTSFLLTGLKGNPRFVGKCGVVFI